ncbi:MAG: YbjN domain-containing protein [Gemmatimonadaceae bacterium]|jgi:hypothetical protein|nr:YbjN domain-containing protein [Gemmatimonadaceae bacterium]
MVTRDDVESFLDRLGPSGAQVREVEQTMWAVRPAGALDFDVVVSINPPVLVLTIDVMPLPTDPAQLATLSRRLLELNASDLVHGAYGIQQESVVLTEALELSHLEFEEFLAAYESMTLALSTHLRDLATYRVAEATPATEAR